MKTKTAMVLAPCAVLLMTACAPARPPATPPPPPEAKLVAEVSSEPGVATVAFNGKALGPAPQTVSLSSADEVLAITATLGDQQAVEKRVRFLSEDRAQVVFLFGEGRSAMAKALGLARILVFDYGAGLTFDVDRSDIKPDFVPFLNRQSGILQNHFAAVDVYVCGHTDATGGRDHNQLLSIERAKAVADFLTSHGVSGQRVRTQGYGSDYPVASNDTPDGRALNRRTEIILPQ